MENSICLKGVKGVGMTVYTDNGPGHMTKIAATPMYGILQGKRLTGAQ